ncbi:MAG: hypothetical protein K2X01_11705 [Cyanobacteria bacterium]|nr:hypothetical protein [Cyanobacteriota bacterium]
MVSIMEISASLSIDDALQCLPLGGKHLEEAVPSPWILTLTEEAAAPPRFVVDIAALKLMQGMGLGYMPVRAIAMRVDDLCLDPTMSFSQQTDEEKQLQEKAVQAISETFTRQLTRYFPGSFVAALYELQSLLNRGEFTAYVIGGITRDALLAEHRRLEIQDVDITVEGNAIACCQWIAEQSRNFTLVEMFPDFGTAKLEYKNQIAFDFASTRKEHYESCGALPTVTERGVPLKLDIHRRDFTVNSLAMSINRLGDIIDYTQGVKDIHSKTLKVLHSASFFEDPSRILRALKFLTRKQFELSPTTRYLIDTFFEYGGQCYRGGGERIKTELKSFLLAFTKREETPNSPSRSSDRSTNWMDYFLSEKILSLANMHLGNISADAWKDIQAHWQKQYDDFYPNLTQLREHFGPHVLNDTIIWEIQLCLLLEPFPENLQAETIDRLILTRSERDCLEAFHQLQMSQKLARIQEKASPAEIYEVLHEIPLAALLAAILSIKRPESLSIKLVRQAIDVYRRKWAHLKTELNGDDLLELGVPSGKAIGRMLKHLLFEKLTGKLPDRANEVSFIKKLLLQPITLEAEPHPQSIVSPSSSWMVLSSDSTTAPFDETEADEGVLYAEELPRE